MAVINIKFEVDNEVQFSRAFQSASNRPQDLTEPFNAMATEFYSSMAQVFAAEGAFEGRKKWQDLSPAYAKWKARHYPGRSILVRTGRMRRSLTSPNSMDAVTQISPTSMALGTRVPYAGYHQRGTSRMVQRKIIELTEKEKLRWVHIMHEWLAGIVKDFKRESRGEV